jgi:hypothetical protein
MQNFTLETVEVQVYLKLGSIWGWLVNATPWLFYLRKRDKFTDI